VSGYFDPLTLEHATRLTGLKVSGRPLVVVIATPENAILPNAARAQLVAGLACVDYVTEGFTAETQLEAEDTQRLEQLIRHVGARQQAAK
jgi:glycerol-3-phosphate cytidylyltransferase-like family protein